MSDFSDLCVDSEPGRAAGALAKTNGLAINEPKTNAKMNQAMKRREFLHATAVGAPTIVAASSVIASSASGQVKPSDRIQVGVIGLGSRGFNLLDQLLAAPEVQIAAICDVDLFHYRDRAWGKGRAYGRRAAKNHIESHHRKNAASQTPRMPLQVTADFREVCRREEIDAVIVATPDHWHAFCTLEALRAGKDVYCEKPITHTFAEGQAVCREVVRRDAVFQTGSQQRSDPMFVRAVELVRNGHLGSIQKVEVGLPPGYDAPQGETEIKPPPEGLDYDSWCGPSPLLPYMRARHHRWWRGHRAYGGGVLMDWIGHHNDIAHWALGEDSSGPTHVEAVNWVDAKTKVYNTPAQYTIRCRYASGVSSTISSQHPLGAKLIGDAGWLFVRRGKIEASDPRWLRPEFKVGEKRVFHSPGHMANFLHCMRTRKPCAAPAETAHRSITPGHLGYVSHALGRELHWDAKSEKVIGDDQANRLLNKSRYRSPWRLSNS